MKKNKKINYFKYLVFITIAQISFNLIVVGSGVEDLFDNNHNNYWTGYFEDTPILNRFGFNLVLNNDLKQDDFGRYEIRNLENLIEFSKIVNGTHTSINKNSEADAILINDIDVIDSIIYSNQNKTLQGIIDGTVDLKNKNEALTDLINLSSRISFEPMEYYQGTFDGNGHTLSNICCHTANNKKNNNNIYCGLFYCILTNGVVKNLSINNSCFISEIKNTEDINDYYIGAIAGSNKGTIHNCHVKNSKLIITEDENQKELEYGYLGGICGYNYSHIKCCSVDSSVISEGSFDGFENLILGGICGESAGENVCGIFYCKCENLEIKMSDNTSSAGGIVGVNYALIHNCLTNNICFNSTADYYNYNEMEGCGGITGYDVGLVDNNICGQLMFNITKNAPRGAICARFSIASMEEESLVEVCNLRNIDNFIMTTGDDERKIEDYAFDADSFLQQISNCYYLQDQDINLNCYDLKDGNFGQKAYIINNNQFGQIYNIFNQSYNIEIDNIWEKYVRYQPSMDCENTDDTSGSIVDQDYFLGN